jgi:hypothetical protein
MFFTITHKTQNIPSVVLQKLMMTEIKNVSSLNNNFKQSKWEKNKLVIIPAVWKEINWANRSSWPLWLRKGLSLFNNNSRPYDIYLYQRIDPNSKYPYDWPYSRNVHQESVIYLQFIRDYYHDLPDKMLFIHGNPFAHSYNPIETAQCVREDVHYASINKQWIQDRPWTTWPADPSDNVSLMYKCVKRLLGLLGFDGELQLNPTNKTPKDNSLMSGLCCAQFYVTKERIHHYTYKQWVSLYNVTQESFCTSIHDQEIPIGAVHKYLGAGFEHLWHVILGLYPTNMAPVKARTNTDNCHLFRPSCVGSPCNNSSV